MAAKNPMEESDTPGTPDKNKLAVALTYERGVDEAPRLAAKGKGLMADQIIAIAREHGIEVRKDADLATLLSTLELDMPIPLEAYTAVAEILSYVYKANAKAKNAPK
ncbi:MAG: EscU/YscU/HrcU family type III secretion system export apparatus switch protein [Rickettsiales bacterium]|nr:EscU/YscU/HrcU family type III secretion system export apparatus switch protein [Rickettsiales bacterium]